jgi:hypothetical protein
VAEVEFVMRPAGPPPSGSSFALQLLDEVSGLANNPTDLALNAEQDGTWRARLTPPVGSVLRYRYRRTAPAGSDEYNAIGEPVRYRLAVVTGSMMINDIVAGWEDTAYTGPAGRITGLLTDAGTGLPLRDILVTAAGSMGFTDGQGAFRLEQLAPGQHNFAALDPTGAHQPIQQGAVVAADSATPVTLALTPAAPVQASFEVTLPSDTPAGAIVRVIGNVRGLGDTYADLAGGQSIDVNRSLALVMVDATHYLGLTTLYAGTDLEYKYTLGDGFWNAERSSKGDPLTRRLIVPTQDAVRLVDVVSTWHASTGDSLTFRVAAPSSTPPGESLSLQLKTSDWTSPLPMWPLGAGEWTYTLHGPTAWDPPLHYRYCRNQLCGAADDVDTPGPQVEGRPADPSPTPLDAVAGWAYWDPASGGATVVAPEILPRTGFEAGYELLAPFDPVWSTALPAAVAEMVAGGANVVTLTPSWTLGPPAALPRLAFDPGRAPFAADVIDQVEAARVAGLAVALHPRLIAPDGDLDAWWAQSPRDGAWWSVWFEQYRAFALTYAVVAEQSGAAKLVLGGREVIPALPGGVLSDGSPSGAPADVETRWDALLTEIRTVFSGRLAWEVDFGSTLLGIPSFAETVQEIHIAWHAPLGEGTELSVEDMQAEAYQLLDAILAEDWIGGRPVYLSVEYLSVDGGATGCAPAPDGACRPPSDFDSGAVVDPDLAVDLPEQSSAINAVILAAYSREAVFGFYVRGFHPAVSLQDKSASVRGKPAQQMLGYWYPRLTGR